MKIDEVLQKSEIFQLFQLFAFDTEYFPRLRPCCSPGLKNPRWPTPKRCAPLHTVGRLEEWKKMYHFVHYVPMETVVYNG
jgi:hypothetical protein